MVEVESPVASETPEEELGSCLKKCVRKRPNVLDKSAQTNNGTKKKVSIACLVSTLDDAHNI